METNVQSVQGAPPTLSPHKSLSRKRPVISGSTPLAPAVRFPRSIPGDFVADSPDTETHAQSPLGSPILLDGESILPPTPPPTGPDHMSRTERGSEGGAPDANGSLKAMSSRRSGLSTPTNGRSPPTPDITPPSEQHLRAPLPSSSLSVATSQAESFRTAREEQLDESSDDDRYSNYTLAGARNASTRAYMEATRALQHSDRGLGFSFEREDGDSTPTQEHHRELSKPLLLPKLRGPGTSVRTAIDKGSVRRGGDDGDEDALDRHRVRNVTLRPKKQPRTPPGQQQDRSPPPQSQVQRSPDSRTKRSPAKEATSSLQSTPEHAAPPKMETVSPRVFSEPTHLLHRSNRNVASKHLSDVSNGSTVVEAVIRVTTPQAASRRLRHVSKVAGLRSFSGSAINISSGSPGSVSRSDRGSLGSDGTHPQHRLHHKRASVGERREQDVLQEERPEEPAMPVLKRPLRHSRDYSHLRPNTSSSTGSTAAPGEDSPQRLRKVADLKVPAQTSSFDGSAVAQPILRSLQDEPNQNVPVLEGWHVPSTQDELSANATAQQPAKMVASQEGLTIAGDPTRGEIQQQEKSAQLKSVLKSRSDKLELGPFPYTQQPPSPTRNRAPSTSTVESQHHLLPVVPLQMQQHSRAMRARLSSNATDVSEPYRAVNFGDEGRVPNDAFEYTTGRDAGSRRSTALTLDDPMSSPTYSSLFPPVTPLSMSSMRSEAQIAEAKAISLFPHTNESLLFIQHGTAPGMMTEREMLAYPQLNGSPVMPAELHRAIDAIENPNTPTPPPTRITTTAETEDILHLTPPGSSSQAGAPQLLVEPSTPTLAAAPAEIDSPLRNPRSAPQPPAFKVIPPTPFSEIEDPLAGSQPQPLPQPSQPPARRISLMQRARRYSDSFLQPLFVRTVSVKRIRRPATGDEAAARDRNLHPQWRPRGFWDDFSDSESDDDEWFGDGEYVVGDDDDRPPRRLPRGGDTSDVRSLDQETEQSRPRSPSPPAALGRMGSVKKVIMDSFRGSGGFLIGNSLGVERAGTNRRRHHISLPARLQARYAPNRGVATLPAHVTERYGAAAGAARHPQQLAEHQQHGTAMASAAAAPNSLTPSTAPGFSYKPTQPLFAPLTSTSPPPHGQYRRSRSLSSFPSLSTLATDQSRQHYVRSGWRRGIRFPLRVEYVGIRGMAERMRERKAERRREELRRRIGRGYLQGGVSG